MEHPEASFQRLTACQGGNCIETRYSTQTGMHIRTTVAPNQAVQIPLAEWNHLLKSVQGGHASPGTWLKRHGYGGFADACSSQELDDLTAAIHNREPQLIIAS